MECMYKKYFTGKGECGLTYPDCMKQVLCIYEDRYHEKLTEAMIAERERNGRDNSETE